MFHMRNQRDKFCVSFGTLDVRMSRNERVDGGQDSQADLPKGVEGNISRQESSKDQL